MYWDTWDGPPRPGGSYATHPAHTVFHWTLLAVSVIDVLMHSYTLYLMLRVATKQLNEYRFFLALSAVRMLLNVELTLDICFAVSFGLLFQPTRYFPVTDCFSARGPLRLFGNEGARVGMSAAFAFAVSTVVSQYYCLMYRITAVLRNQNIKDRFLSLPVVAIFLSLGALIFALVFFGIWLAAYWQPGAFDALLREAAKREMLSLDEPSIVCFNAGRLAPYVLVYHGYRGYSDWVFVIFVGASLFVQTFFSACAVWTIRYLGKPKDAITAKSRRMHLQFVWLVLVQMLCPVVCMVVPFAVTSAFASSMSIVANCLIMLGFGVFPAVNAILTVLFVSPYRKRTAQLLMVLVKVNRIGASVVAATVEQTESSAQSLSSNNGQRMMQASTRRLQVTPVFVA